MQLCNITMFLLPSFIVMSTLPGNDQITLSRSSLPPLCCPWQHDLPGTVEHGAHYSCPSLHLAVQPVVAIFFPVVFLIHASPAIVRGGPYHLVIPFLLLFITPASHFPLQGYHTATAIFFQLHCHPLLTKVKNLGHVDILKYPSSFFICLYPKSLNLLIPLSHSQIVQLWLGSWTFPQNSQSILASTHPLCTPVHPLCLHWSVLFANFNSNNNSVSSMGFFPPNCCRSYSSPLKICNVNCKINKVNKTNMFSLPAGCEKNSHASLWNRKQIIRLLGASPELHVSFSNQLYGINSLYIII